MDVGCCIIQCVQVLSDILVETELKRVETKAAVFDLIYLLHLGLATGDLSVGQMLRPFLFVVVWT